VVTGDDSTMSARGLAGKTAIAVVRGKQVATASLRRVFQEQRIDRFLLGLQCSARIGLDLGLITTTVFAMMVVMTIATTIMTAPGLLLNDYLCDQQREGFATRVAPTPVEHGRSFPSAYDSIARAKRPRPEVGSPS
jgi:hypothetical protein